MIHLYAFAEQLDDLPASAGLDGAPLERRFLDGVTAVFSRRTGVSSSETLRSDALAHGAVVEALMPRATAVVPVRFGEVVADDAALSASLRARAPMLRRTFGSVRGCVEISLRVWGAVAQDAPPPATGADYLRARAAVESVRREAVDGLHRELARIARAVSLGGAVADPRERFSAAYLLPDDRIDDARRLVESFAASHDELTVVCTGPWPPFSFVEEVA